MAIISEAADTASQKVSSRSRVAVIKTRPECVLDDVGRVMRAAGSADLLSPSVRTGLKINISWQVYYPGCSTTPGLDCGEAGTSCVP